MIEMKEKQKRENKNKTKKCEQKQIKKAQTSCRPQSKSLIQYEFVEQTECCKCVYAPSFVSDI